MAQEATSDTTLRLVRAFAAPREEVFRAWTDPAALTQWWLPRAGFTVPHAEVDLRVGGRYCVAMRNPQGEVISLAGTYREVLPPERLVYTWRWERSDMDIGETLVTVEFRAVRSATEVVVTHELFPDTPARDRHDQGWSGCLEQLAALLARGATNARTI